MSESNGGKVLTCRAPRVLIHERVRPDDGSIQWLRDCGVQVMLGQANIDTEFKRYSDDQLILAMQGMDGALGSSSAHFNSHVIESLPQLRFISKIGIGVDNIDLTAATRRGVLVSNTPGDDDYAAVAEHAIALMLALRKRLPTWNLDYMRKGGWRSDVYSSMLDGTTVGIVGLGRIGRQVVRRLAGWNVSILAFDPFIQEAPNGVVMTGLDGLLAEADVVTLHCPPTNDNHHIIDARALSLMKHSAILINTGRGSLVDYAALKSALRGGMIAGAGLDVYEVEPPDPSDDLFRFDNLICTPHVASWTLDGYLNRRRHAARNMVAMLTGVGHADVVNAEARVNGGQLPIYQIKGVPETP